MPAVNARQHRQHLFRATAHHLCTVPVPWRRGSQWEHAALREHLQPLLDAAAEELQACAARGGSAADSGPATCLVLALAEHLPSPWQLGCRVPEPLLQLLWGRYCAHLADSALEEDLEPLASQGGAARLAVAAGEGLAAAPSAAHVARLATELVQRFAEACVDSEVQPRVALAALEAAHTLAASSEDSIDDHEIGRGLLVAALAACPWLIGEAQEASGVRSEALAVLRRCLHHPGSLVPLLLDLDCCQDLRQAVLGTKPAQQEVPSLGWLACRRSAVPRRGRRAKRLTLDPSFLR